MFNKHSRIRTKTDSLNLLIVDVQDDCIAFIDLNHSVVKRRARTESAKRPTPNRHQSKPKSMDLSEFLEEINNYDFEVDGYEYKNGLHLPKGKSVVKQAEIKEERVEQATINYELIRPIVEDKTKRLAYLYKKSGNQIIVERSKETGVKAEHISRLLCQYFMRGGSFNAMFPNYRYCGSSFVLPNKVSDWTSQLSLDSF